MKKRSKTSAIIFPVQEDCFLLRENSRNNKILEGFYYRPREIHTDIRKMACDSIKDEGVTINPKDLKIVGVIDKDDPEEHIFVYTCETFEYVSKKHIWSRFMETSTKFGRMTKKILTSITQQKPLPDLNKKSVSKCN